MKSFGNVFFVFLLITVLLAHALPSNLKNKNGNGLSIKYVPPLYGTDVNCPSVEYDNDATSGRLYTPNFPGKYPSNSNCTYLIQTTLDKTITVVFEIFEVEPCCDAVYVYNGPQEEDLLLQKFSGNMSTKSISTNGSNIMKILFTSDQNLNYQGFYAVFQAQDTKLADPGTYPQYQCSSNFTEPFGAIVSPNFPEPYLPNTDCTYLIGNGVGQVTLTMEFFDTEPCCDHLRLYDGFNNSADLMMDPSRMSGVSVMGSTYKSSKGYIYVEFVSDATQEGAGYSLKYEIQDETQNVDIPIHINLKK